MSRTSADTWNHILTLMAAIVVSDARVVEDEIDSFLKNVKLIADDLDRALEVSEDDLIHWFNAKRNHIAQQTTHQNMNRFIVNNIISLEPFYEKQTLLNCLISIAASDSDMHEKEVDIINIAAAYWELSPIRRN